MLMKILTRTLFLVLLSISTNSYSVEITPILGFRGGGDFTDTTNDSTHTVVASEIYGLILGFPYERGKSIEVYYSHQSSQLNSINVEGQPDPVDIPLTIDYLHFGGTAPISKQKDLETFVSGGLGFTYLSTDFPDTQSDLRASFSLGIGLKWPITDSIALRLETRGLGTLFNSNSTIFCSGGCAINVSGSLFIQGEVFAGLAFKF